jgi:ATP-dependent protease ClpP protease subunit
MNGHIFITKHIGDTGDTQMGVRLFDIVSEVQAQPEATRFVVHISSPGGNHDESENISSYLDRLQQRIEVIAIGEGVVASAASKIFLSINKRSAGDNFQLMIHNPWGGVEGDSKYIAEYADIVGKIEKEYEKFYSSKFNIDEQTLSALMDSETYINTEDAKKFGLINYEYSESTPQIVFALKTNPKNEEKMTSEDKNWLQQTFDEIKAFMKATPVKALLIMSNEGQELNFPGDEPKEGDTVTAMDGTYTFMYAEKNWTATIENNVVTSLTEVEPVAPEAEPNAELEALKAENELLKQQVSDVTAMLKTELEPLRAYVQAHKEVQSQHEPETKAPANFEEPKVDPIEARLQAAREKVNKLRTNKR